MRPTSRLTTTNGYLTFTFKRKRDTGDKSDYNLATSCPRLFFGVGGNVVDAQGTIRKHIAVPYVSPQQICFRPCGAVGNPDVSSMTEKNYKIQGELTLRNEVFVPALSDPKSPEFQKRAADVMSNVEHVLRPFFGDRLYHRGLPAELKSASSLDEVVQKANATLREQLPYENFSLRLAEFSPVSANEMHQEGLSEVEIIVIALAVALVVVAIIIAVCKIVEVKKAKSGYKRGVIREYSMSSGNTATTTMTYREFIASGDADASYEGKKPPSSGSSAYVNHAYDASGYQKNAP
ncbi:hypothetical protein C0Q70_16818 [Pomacea canaliculata]|uniref:SEA domain-containing protein n=1 Tax=Pomacea canaliculata TaxID=400727 RepID=A0A2T7NQW6_POMCA|nr:hypothetical protein C0Q70_16818 [Pomacea canaliculata]